MEMFYDLVYGNYGSEENQEKFKDIDDLKSCFKSLVNIGRFDYVVARKIIIYDDGTDDIDIIWNFQN